MYSFLPLDITLSHIASKVVPAIYVVERNLTCVEGNAVNVPTIYVAVNTVMMVVFYNHP